MLAWEAKYLRFGAYLLKCTRSATEMGFKAPDLTECLAILTAAYSASHPVLRSDLTGFGSSDIAMSTVMHLGGDKKRTRIY
jgi:hypothetical protein